MTAVKLRFPAILILLSQAVPLSACTSPDSDKGENEEAEHIREHNECLVFIACDSAHFAFSDPLAPGAYELHLELPDEDVDCTLVVNADESASDDCGIDGLQINAEYLEINQNSQGVALELTDDSGCSAEGAVASSNYLSDSGDCGGDCEGASTALDVSECAQNWEIVTERPECQIGSDWSEWCTEFYAGLWTQTIEGCGYTWIRWLYADSQRDTIVDADGVVVFQEYTDPLSTINPAGCRGGSIPECEDLPENTDTEWDIPAPIQGDECWDQGLGGAGGAGQ